MLTKKANLTVTKDEKGFVLFDEISLNGARMADKRILKLTLLIWEHCDKLDQEKLIEKVTGKTQLSDNQKMAIHKLVEHSLALFERMEWVAKRSL